MLNLDMVARLNGRDLLIDGSMGDVPSRTLANSVARALGVPIDVPGLTRIVDVAEGIVRAAARRAWLPRQTSSITTR